ncbi:MAG: cysteine synthase family protein [Anaerolineae bacterium]|nr:cysteine synthase family protein [Anaerolineae bacterium]MCI0611224.1 cysteine synthase family protein [Anaerolineae bacterium]
MTLIYHKPFQPDIDSAKGLTSHVGDTPLLPLQKLDLSLSPRTKVFAKAEWFNPSGSVKDRPALNIIQTALANGDLLQPQSFAKHPRGTAAGTPPGVYKRLLDSTSGNMGISYATFGAALGIPVTLTIPSSASSERLTTLRALGAELILTDPTEGSDGAILEARRLAEEKPDLYWYARQYDNPANWQAHYETTGPEIVSQTNGEVTHFIAGLGTSGTLIGTGKYLREHLPDVNIIAFQPDASFHGLEGLKHMPTAIQPGIYDPFFADDTLEVKTEDAHEMVRRLAREEGLFVGISSGAAAIVALRVASELEEGIVVTIFPDAGYKYLSDKVLWESPVSVRAERSASEVEAGRRPG